MKCAVIGRFKSFFTISFALVLPVNSYKKSNHIYYSARCIIIKVLVVRHKTYNWQKTRHAVQKERMFYATLDKPIFKMLISPNTSCLRKLVFLYKVASITFSICNIGIILS